MALNPADQTREVKTPRRLDIEMSQRLNMELALSGYKAYMWYSDKEDANPPEPLPGLIAVPIQEFYPKWRKHIVLYAPEGTSFAPAGRKSSRGRWLGETLGYVYPMEDLDLDGRWVWFRVDKVILWGESLPSSYDSELLNARIEGFKGAVRQINPGFKSSATIVQPPRSFGKPYVA